MSSSRRGTRNSIRDDLCLKCWNGIPLDDEGLQEYVTEVKPHKVILVEDRDSQDPFGVFLDYERNDIIPGFPSLSKSANYGCHFCKQLLKAVVERDHFYTGSARIRFEYIWYANAQDPRVANLSFLRAVVIVDTSRNNASVPPWQDFFFTIHTDHGLSADQGPRFPLS
jgi:hypothetical protein